MKWQLCAAGDAYRLTEEIRMAKCEGGREHRVRYDQKIPKIDEELLSSDTVFSPTEKVLQMSSFIYVAIGLN